MYFPEKYSQPNPVDLEALIWFPYLPMPVSTPFDLRAYPSRTHHTINDNDMLSYSLTTMMCFLTKE